VDYSRRGLLGGALAAVPAGSFAGALNAIAPSDPGRPPFHIAREGAGTWRFRSWTWAEGAWRPLTGRITVDGAALQVSGKPDPRDARALQAALGRIVRDRSG
jgi:hypothetical protein